MGVGVFTPSMPANVLFPEKYQHGLGVIKSLGFEVVEGHITQSGVSEGYRTASPQDRADEFMRLIRNPKVHALVSTIGGNNSSSLIPFLDFDEIRESRKVICGYSDVTSLHLAILKHSGLRTFYGPAVMPSFGEWPTMLDYTKDSFLIATMNSDKAVREIKPPAVWSNHFREAKTDAWKTMARDYKPNPGWAVLRDGDIEGRLVLANLSTLCSNAGTDIFPDLENKILLVETMSGTAATEERLFRHLERMGVFDAISGLIVGKIEDYKTSGEPFSHDELILEIVGSEAKFPIVTGFDCSHTNPMLTLAEDCLISLSARTNTPAQFKVIEPMVAD
ncbi:MAG: LD-carboxypeptidase [Proteobacteria bacterium]|nr:MAG: LD-carboxypeptidase [Pseudomonadota bacterium]